MALTFTQVTGTFDDGSGTALSGTVTFTPSALLYASGVPVAQPDVPVQAQITAGTLKNTSGGTVSLLATDNAGLTVEGQTGFWYWTVQLTVAGQVQPSWSFFLPSAPSTVDLYTLANTPAGGGGLTNPMTTLGDMIDGGASGTPTRLAGNTTATKKFLTQTGNGSVSAAPVWGTIAAADVPAATGGAQGAVQLAGDLGGTAASPQVVGTHLAAALPIAQGGTGTAAGPANTSFCGAPAFRALVAADVPTLNQSTTGNAATATNLAGGATLPAYLAPHVATLTFVGSGTTLVDASLGNAFNLTLTASTTTLGNPSNPVDGEVIRVRLGQDATGSRTIAYGTAYDFGAAGAPTLSTGASKVDILGFEYVASLSKWCYLGSGLGF